MSREPVNTATPEIRQPDFGRRLRLHRLGLGLSQKAIASDFVSASYVSLLESGVRVPTLDVAAHLARSMNVPLRRLLGEDASALLPLERGGESTRVLVLLEARECVQSGEFGTACSLLASAIEELRELGEYQRMVDLGAEYQSVLGVLGRHDERVAFIDELLLLPLLSDSAEVRLPLETDRASALRESGRLHEAARSARATLQTLQASVLADTREDVRLLAVLISIQCELGELDDVEALVEEMLAKAEALGSRGVSGRAYWAAGLAQATLGLRDEALASLGQAHGLLSYSTMRLVDWLRFCRSYASTLLDLDGDRETIRAWLDMVDESARMAGLEGERAASAVLRARYELSAGDARKAAELLADATGEDKGLTGLVYVGALLTRAEALRLIDERDEAVEVLRRAAQYAELQGIYRYAAEAWRKIDELRPPASKR